MHRDARPHPYGTHSVHLFLHDEARVTIEGRRGCWGGAGGEIAAAIRDGEIETTSGCGGTVIDIRELAEQAVHVWPVGAIEEALGREAALILPAEVRTRRFTARLPRYIRGAGVPGRGEWESADALLTGRVRQ